MDDQELNVNLAKALEFLYRESRVTLESRAPTPLLGSAVKKAQQALGDIHD